MPSYEFECKKCKKIFTLVLSIDEYKKGKFKCPDCGSNNVQRVYSQFYAVTSKKS
jgi:putative FmdB family regulatory protein